MTIAITGMGWVTPLGRGLENVWPKVQAGERPATSPLENPFNHRAVPVARIAPEDIKDATSLPRLRRSSAISHFAVAAARDAVAAAGLDADQLARTALVFAASDGGVIYTRRFFADLVERGEGAGSPLLFPETVYNAPASHIAAATGLRSDALTLVGDASVAFSAIQTAAEIIATGEADHCLVAGAQELDWITGEAYRRWSLIPAAPDSPQTVFAEGAAALVLSKSPGICTLSEIVSGPAKLRTLVNRLQQRNAPLILASDATGSPNFEPFIRPVTAALPRALHLQPKHSLGEALVCSSLQQIISAALALRAAPAAAALCFTAGFRALPAGLILTPYSKHDD